MSSKPASTSGEDALKGSAEAAGDPAAPRRDRTRRSAHASLNGQSACHAPAGSDRPSSREALIATAAYYRAEKRGFLPGHEQEDWLAAERDIDGVGSKP
jgi:hypothetical protein